MHLFHDSALNLWRFHPGELPEKPDIEDFPSEKSWIYNIDKYNEAIVAIKQNALTVQNPEILKQFDYLALSKNGDFIIWPGDYETKERDTVKITAGGYPLIGTQTVTILTLPEDSGHSFTEGMKITPERAKEVEQGINNWRGKEEKKWTIGWMFNQQALMFDGCISAISLEEICDGLNELESLRNQLAKQEVAFRETVKLQFEEIKQRDELLVKCVKIISQEDICLTTSDVELLKEIEASLSAKTEKE